MKIIIPLIALLFVLGVFYVNRYMIKHCKKEFALQIIMGIEQWTTAYLFFIEMFLIGLVAVIFGIILGTLLSQLVSAIIMASFGENYQFYFSVFPDTVLWTWVFFTALFAVIGLGNVQVIRKQKIIDMLHDDHEMESTATVKDMLLKSLILASLLAISILYLNCKSVLLFWSKLGHDAMVPTIICVFSTVVFLILAIAFFIRTCRLKKEGSLIDALLFITSVLSGVSLLCMTGLFEDLLRSGMITGGIHSFGPPLLAAGMILFSIVSLFSCLSWLLVLVKKRSAHFKYKYLFLLGQIISKMNTNSKTMAVLTCVLLSATVLLGWLPVVTGEVDGYLQARSVYDISVFTQYRGAGSIEDLPKSSINGTYINTYLEKNGYTIADSANVGTYFLKDSDFNIYLVEDMPILAVSLSDFNSILRLDNQEAITLPDGSFSVAWENTALPYEIEQFGKEHSSIQIGENIFKKAFGSDYKVDMGTGIFADKKKVVYILPDAICDSLTLATSDYNVNTTQPLSYDFAVKLEKEITEWLNSTGTISKGSGGVQLKTLDYNEGISNSLMIRLGGSYTSLVLIVICFTVLALQQLTDATEHKQRFKVIGNLGLDQKEIGKYIRQQMSVWFGIPILLAFCGAGGTFAYLAITNYQDYIPYVTMNQVLMNIFSVFGVILLVLVCYSAATYILFKRNIMEK